MISAGFRLAAIVLSLVWLSVSAAQSQGRRTPQVSFVPAAIRPGDVVRVQIEDVPATERVHAQVLGQDLDLVHDQRRNAWHALMGVDLDTEPGTYSMSIHHADGALSVHALRVVPRPFRVRKLTVSPEFVDPPPETIAQIELDAKTLGEVYALVSPQKWTGRFLLPVDGTPSSNFGTRSYYNGQRRGAHAGVDFSGATGTPIRAANHGTVALAAPLYFTGNTIVIDHGARLFSIFAHLSEFKVRQGDTVQPRTVVGLVGATGRVTGPHLHWSVRLNGARVDPMSLIAATAQ